MTPTFEEIFSFESLYRAFQASCRSKRRKEQQARFEAQALPILLDLSDAILEGTYRPGRFEEFYVYEPKKRLVQAPAYRDKVVQHALVDNYLYDAITRRFIVENGASQKGRGTHYNLDLTRIQFMDYCRKTRRTDGWVCKFDIRQFFHSIDHDILKEKLTEIIGDARIRNLLFMYIDASPIGLPLGYQTSQLCALLYLNDFDHWVKERLGVQWYNRYMDDFFMIARSKEEARAYMDEATAQIHALKLDFNEKTQIFPLRHGIDYLGFHTYLSATGAVYSRLRRSSVKRNMQALRFWEKALAEGVITKEKIIDQWRSRDAHAAHGNTLEWRRMFAARTSEIVGEQLTPCRPLWRTQGIFS